MSDGIYTALSGAVAQQRALDVVANNVANTGTVGFRADRVAFREAVGAAGTLRSVSVASVRPDPTDGPLQQTGNVLDLALSGDGMLAVQTPSGVRYTRAGSLVMDSEGNVRTRAGHAVLTAAGELVLPPGTTGIQIGEDGTVRAGEQELATLRIERFAPGALAKEGLTLYAPVGGARGEAATDVRVMQGFLEGANVSPIHGMNELITASRSFEAFQRVIHAFRQIDERTARELGDSR